MYFVGSFGRTLVGRRHRIAAGAGRRHEPAPALAIEVDALQASARSRCARCRRDPLSQRRADRRNARGGGSAGYTTPWRRAGLPAGRIRRQRKAGAGQLGRAPFPEISRRPPVAGAFWTSRWRVLTPPMACSNSGRGVRSRHREKCSRGRPGRGFWSSAAASRPRS